MDYLRTIGSAAVSTVLSKSGLNLPFSLGQKIPLHGSVCTLYEATKRDDSSAVSVFEYDLSDPSRRSYIPLAKNALRKLRTMRHPDLLKFIDVVETDATIYIVTERIKPLRPVLHSLSSKKKEEREDYLLWGLHRIAVALAFLNESGSSTHGSVRIDSIFISPSGEWKLGGFEVLSNPSDQAAILYTLGGLLPESSNWASPEVQKNGWSILKDEPVPAADAYALGLLLHAIFNPTHALPATAKPPHPPPTASSRGDIPPSLFPHFKKLLNPNPRSRQTPQDFLAIGMSEATGFFSHNRLVKVCNGLDNFSLLSEGEKNALLKTLKDSSGSFPTEFVSYRILPSLATALERGGASASAILPLVLQFGANIDPAEYSNVVVTPLVKLYESPDRGTRMALLEHLPEYIDKMDKKVVTDKIFPHLQTGFSDTVAVIREATVKSISLFAPKLSDRLLNNELLRHMAKMQSDQEASIRTNACILMGRLAPSLSSTTKKKVLVPAFSKAAKDPFVHCRVAGLMAFMATVDCFDPQDLATKVLPAVCYALVDKEKLARDQAFKAVEFFVKALEKHASTMPETVLPHEMPSNATTTQSGTLVNSAAGAAGALAGWAMTSITKKLATEEMQSSMHTAGATRPQSTPSHSNLDTSSLSVPGAFTTSSASSSRPTTPSALSSDFGRSPPKAKGLQLGANKVSSNMAAAAAVLAEDFSQEGGEPSNPWGEDLMDVNNDDADWGAFESAPTTPEPVLHTTTPARNGLGFGANGITGSQPSPSVKRLSTHAAAPKPKAPPSPQLKAQVASDDWDSTAVDDWDDGEKRKPAKGRIAVQSKGAPMTKEEKAAEMQRRKDERKQRIAALKEQKKSAPK